MGSKTKNYLVITIDSYDVFGIYEECESFYALTDLYKHLENDIDKFYTLEDKISYHYETLIELYKLFNKIGLDLKNEKYLNDFLNV